MSSNVSFEPAPKLTRMSACLTRLFRATAAGGCARSVTAAPIAATPVGKHEIGRRRQHAAVGDVGHLELPLELARLRIERLNRAPSLLRRALVDGAGAGPQRRHRHRREASGVLVTLLVLDVALRIGRVGIHPAWNVKQSGARAV